MWETDGVRNPQEQKEEEKPAKECAMCLKSEGMEPVPEETARLAHIVCPADTLCLLMRDELGEVFQD